MKYLEKFKNANIDKYINSKTINIVTIIFCFLFSFVLMFNGIYANTQHNNLANEYSRRMELLNLYNKNFIYSNGLNSNDQASDNKETSLFKNAKEAVLFAFDKLNNYSSFELVCSGVTMSSAAGMNVEIIFDTTYCKYESGVEFMQNIRLETKTNFGQSDASQTLYKNGEAYKSKGSKIKMNGDKLQAKFSGNFKKDNDSKLTSLPLYIVDESTIEFSNRFTINRNANGKIRGYYASVELSPQLSVKYYAQAVKEQGGTSLPKFSKVTVNCELDKNGNIVSFSVNEKMKATKTVVVPVDASINNQCTFKLISYNQTPSYPEPII